MLEAKSFDSVGELDVDPQVVAIEFQLISRPKATIFANVECKGRHIAIGRQFPVTVPRGVRLECNELVRTLTPPMAIVTWHYTTAMMSGSAL